MSRVYLLINDPLVAGRMRRHRLRRRAQDRGLGHHARTGTRRFARPGRRRRAGRSAAGRRLGGGLRRRARQQRPHTAGPRRCWPRSLDDSQLSGRAARGADGYFVRGLSPNMLIATVEQVLAGGAEMAPVIARQVKAHFDAAAWTVKEPLDDDNPLHPGSPSARCCNAIWRRPPHEIARDLRISTREVAQRVRTLYRKLHLDRRTIVPVATADLNPTLRASAAVSMKLCRVASFSASFARLRGGRASRSAGSGSRGSRARSRPRCRPAGGCHGTRVSRPGRWLIAFSALSTWLSWRSIRPASAGPRRARPGGPGRAGMAASIRAVGQRLPRCAPRCGRAPIRGSGDSAASACRGIRRSRARSNTASPPSSTRQGTLPSGLA